MKSIVLCVFVLSCASFLEAGHGRFRCDYTYFSEGKGWYKLHGVRQNWMDAKTTCSVEGAVLVEPTSKGMEDALLLLMQNTTFVHVRTDVEWQDDKYDGHKSFTRNGTYWDVHDRAPLPFVCYRQLGEIVQLNECGNLDRAYRLDNRTGNCYKYHSEYPAWIYKYYSEHQAWFDARQTCEMEEGQLAIINSEDEAQVIRDIFLEHPHNPQEWKDGAIIGISSFGGDWHTLEGLTLTEAGYDVWRAGEPNNARGDEFCGSISREGELVDDPCTRTLAFICEKKPDSGCNVHDPIADSQPIIVTNDDVGQTLTEAGYNVWRAGEPNNARGDEFCGSISREGELVDDPCTRTLAFICEKKPDSGCNVHDPIADSQPIIVTKDDVGEYQVDDMNNSY